MVTGMCLHVPVLGQVGVGLFLAKQAPVKMQPPLLSTMQYVTLQVALCILAKLFVKVLSGI